MAHPAYKVYPYRLSGVEITHVNQGWSADSPFLPMAHGCMGMYRVVVIDWFSRYVLAWQLSNTLEGAFCLDAWQHALHWGKPEIFNTDPCARTGIHYQWR
jgi:putative transposase